MLKLFENPFIHSALSNFMSLDGFREAESLMKKYNFCFDVTYGNLEYFMFAIRYENQKYS